MSRERMASMVGENGSTTEFLGPGQKYDIIRLPEGQQFLEGGRIGWDYTDFDEALLSITSRLQLLNPANWRHLRMTAVPARGTYAGSYREVLAQAVELGADALIHSKIIHGGLYQRYWESGVPVKKHQEVPDANAH